jgi:hypothetical protein
MTSYTNEKLACFNIIKYVLQTHDDKTLTSLSIDEINDTAEYISDLYVNGTLTKEQLIRFLVFSDQSGICKFALTFNNELNRSIINGDSNILKQLLTGSDEMFVELYDNPLLSSSDADYIFRMLDREWHAMSYTFELSKIENPNLADDIDRKCNISTIEGNINDDNTLSVVATKCYDDVCIYDGKILNDDLVRANMSKYDKPPSTVYTIDKPPTDINPQIFCFSTLELLDAVTSSSTPINPKTGYPFSQYSLQLINQRFHKEIPLILRYKQLATQYSLAQ